MCGTCSLKRKHNDWINTDYTGDIFYVLNRIISFISINFVTIEAINWLCNYACLAAGVWQHGTPAIVLESARFWTVINNKCNYWGPSLLGMIERHCWVDKVMGLMDCLTFGMSKLRQAAGTELRHCTSVLHATYKAVTGHFTFWISLSLRLSLSLLLIFR